MILENKLNNEESINAIKKISAKRLTVSFYNYCEIKNCKIFRNFLFLELKNLNVLGRIYISKEGINAQLSVPEKKLKNLSDFLKEISFLKKININIGIEHDNFSFLKLKIKIKSKIVADGLSANEINLKNRGKHVDAKEFNNLLKSNDTITIDMRNHYESRIGHFEGAFLPDVDTFKQSLPFVYNKIKKFKTTRQILMYCTGGIRCEKASSYFIKKGFKNVYQLRGGIINYTNQTRKEKIENLFVGKNFVFDNRLSERISGKIISKCDQCKNKCDSYTNCSNEACHLLFIQCKRCKKKFSGCCSLECQEIYSLPEKTRRNLRKNTKSCKTFTKGRFN